MFSYTPNSIDPAATPILAGNDLADKHCTVTLGATPHSLIGLAPNTPTDPWVLRAEYPVLQGKTRGKYLCGAGHWQAGTPWRRPCLDNGQNMA